MQPNYHTIAAGVPKQFLRNATDFVIRGYDLADTIVASVPFLQTNCGYDLLSYLRNVAVEYVFLTEYQAGSEISCIENKNKGKNCHHVEIMFGDSIITISRAHEKLDLPRKSEFRNSLSQGEQQIFSDMFSANVVRDFSSYFILTHGGKSVLRAKPSFVAIGLPDEECKRWRSHSVIYEPSQLTSVKTNPHEAPAPVEENLILGFREFYDEVAGNAKLRSS